MAKKLALFVFIVLTPWIFFDVDLGDQPYMSLMGWLMAFHPAPPATSYPYWFEAVPVWGSFMQDFFIFKILGPGTPLLVLRFIWVLWHVAMAVILFQILKRWWEPRKVAIALGLTTLACVVGADHFAPTYYSIPVGYAVLSVTLLALALEKNKNWAVLSGFFGVLALTSRLSATPFFLLYLAALFLIFRSIRPLFKQILIGCLFGVAFAYIFLLLSHQEHYIIPGVISFFEGFIHKANIRFRGLGIVPKMLMHYLRILVGAVFFLGFTIPISKMRSQKLQTVPLFLVGILISIVSFYKYGAALGFVIGGALSLLIFSYFKRFKSVSLREWVLGLGGLMIFIAFPFGTFSEGLQFYKYGLWLILPLAFLVKTPPAQEKWFALSRQTLTFSIIILFLVTRITWPTFPYHEQSITRMSEMFSNPALKGIFTYPEKKKSLESLVEELHRQGVNKGDTLFCYAGASPYYPISIVYVMTGTIPLFNDPGLVEYPGARWERYTRLIKEEGQAETLPKVIVRQKKHFTIKNITPFQWTDATNNSLAGEIDSLLKGFGYKLVWEDQFFAILKK